MGLKNIHILILFCIYLLSTRIFAYSRKEYPSIHPIPCQNHMTGESGVCTYSWFCKNVAHGVHIGSCVDRFFVGACCKTGNITREQDTNISNINEETETSQKYYQLHEKVIQMESFSEIIDDTIRPTQESVKYPLPMKVIVFENTNSKTYNESTSSVVIPNKGISPTSSYSKPLSSETFLTSFTLENTKSQTHKQSLNEQVTSSAATYPIKSTTFVPSIQKYSSLTDIPQNDISTTESPVDEILLNHKNSLQQELLHQKNSMQLLEKYISQILSSHETQSHQWTDPHTKYDGDVSIILEDTNKDASKSEQNAQDQMSSDTFISWAYSILTASDKNITENRFNVASNIRKNASAFTSTNTRPSFKPSQLPTSESQYAFTFDNVLPFTTLNDVDRAPLTTGHIFHQENSPNIDELYSNITRFTEPQYPWPSPETTSSTQTTSTPKTDILKDVSRICGRSRSNIMARIVGGRKSHYLRWPWMISLRRFEGKSFKHKCGAALLNQLWAITAAHCVDGKLPSDVVLRLGEHNFYRMDEVHPHVERRIYMIVIHPHFDPTTYENDLALLRFYEPVSFQANIVPVCLPKFVEDIAGRTAVVTGWGRLSEEGELPESLHEVQMPILTNKECEEMYSQAGYAEAIRDVFVCAGLMNGGLDACEGDSGGPMVVKGDRGQWMLVGLISWGMGCAAPRQPGVYTRITKFVEWIDEIILY